MSLSIFQVLIKFFARKIFLSAKNVIIMSFKSVVSKKAIHLRVFKKKSSFFSIFSKETKYSDNLSKSWGKSSS